MIVMEPASAAESLIRHVAQDPQLVAASVTTVSVTAVLADSVRAIVQIAPVAAWAVHAIVRSTWRNRLSIGIVVLIHDA